MFFSVLVQWLRAKLSPLIEDYDADTLQVDMRHGTVSLNSVRVAQEALTVASKQLRAQAPLTVKALSIGAIKVQVDWHGVVLNSVSIIVDDVKLEVATQPADEWNVKEVAEAMRTAKQRELDLHQEMVAYAYREGAGIIHVIATKVLENVDFCLTRWNCELHDEASFRGLGSFMQSFAVPARQDFILGTQFEKLELLRAGTRVAGAVFRELVMERPSMYLDTDPPTPSSSSGAGAARNRRRTTSVNRTSSCWILPPSENLRAELGLLQCMKVAHVPPDSKANQDNEGISIREFAELALPFHSFENISRSGSVKEDQSKNDKDLPLPRSAVVMALQNMHLQLSPACVEALTALSAYVGLGYTAFKDGVVRIQGWPSHEAMTAYGEEWLRATVLGGEVTEEMHKSRVEFEEKHPFISIIEAREIALAQASEEVTAMEEQQKDSARRATFFDQGLEHVRLHARMMKRRFCINNNTNEASDFETVQAIRETLAFQFPLWREAFRDICKATSILVGGRFMNLQVHFIPDEELAELASSPATMKASELQHLVTIGMREVVFSATKQPNGFINLQASCFNFHVDDTYGPWKLERMFQGSCEAWPTRMPTTTKLVRSGEVAQVAQGGPDLERSELYFSFGKRPNHGGEPDMRVRLKSVNALRVHLPPSQLLAVFDCIFPLVSRHRLYYVLRGVPWMAGISPDVSEVIQDGLNLNLLRMFKGHEIYKRVQLEVDMEPVLLLLPVPGAETASLGDGTFLWTQAFRVNLGRLTCFSSLAFQAQGSDSTTGNTGCFGPTGSVDKDKLDRHSSTLEHHGSMVDRHSSMLDRNSSVEARDRIGRHSSARSTASADCGDEPDLPWAFGTIISQVGADVYDRYTLRITGLSIQRCSAKVGANQGIEVKVVREIVPKTASTTLVYVRPTVEPHHPRLLIEGSHSDVDVLATSDEVLVLLRAGFELMFVILELRLQGLIRTAKDTFQHYLAELVGPLRRQVRRPDVRINARRQLLLERMDSFLIFRAYMGRMRLGVELNGEGNAFTHLEFLVINQEWLLQMCRTGTTLISFSVATVDLGSLKSHRLYHGGAPKKKVGKEREDNTRPSNTGLQRMASSSLGSLPSQGKLNIAPPHLRIDLDLKVPETHEESWVFAVGVVVDQPVFLVSWPLVQNLASTGAHIWNQALEITEMTPLGSGALDSLLGRARRRSRLLSQDMMERTFRRRTNLPLVLPDHILFQVKVDNARVLFPTSYEATIPSFAPGEPTQPMFSASGSFHFMLEGTGCSAISCYRSLGVRFRGHPRAVVKGSLFGGAVQLISPAKSLAKVHFADHFDWVLHPAGQQATPIVMPFRFNFGICLKDKWHIAADLRTNRIKVYIESSVIPWLQELAKTAKESLDGMMNCDYSSGPCFDVDEDAAGVTHMDSGTGLLLSPKAMEIRDTLVTGVSVMSKALTEDSVIDTAFTGETDGAKHTFKEVLSMACVDLDASAQALVVHLAGPSSNRGSLYAELFLEDTKLKLWHATKRMAGVRGYHTTFQTTFHADALDNWARQIEPVVEPVHVTLDVGVSGSLREAFPRGKVGLSWVNVNLPLGVLYSVKILMQQPERVSTMSRKSRSNSGLERVQLSSEGIVEEDHTEEVTTTHHNCLDLEAEPQIVIVNLLGTTIYVREAEGMSDWIRVTHGNKEVLPDSEQAGVVPQIVLRLQIRGQIFEVETLHVLHVLQFQIVQLIAKDFDRMRGPGSPSTAGKQGLAILLRAVAGPRGRGCFLYVSTAIFLRNNTHRSISFRVPEREERMIPMEEASADKGTERYEPYKKQHVIRGCNLHSSATSMPPVDTFQSTRTDQAIGREPAAADSLSFSDASLGATRRIPLPIAWLEAAADLSRSSELKVGLAGATAQRQILPKETLSALGRYNFAKSRRGDHGEAIDRGKLDGELLKLADIDDSPVHLCATTVLGIVEDRVCCLEVVVSSCSYVVNHLPVPITIQMQVADFRAHVSEVREGSMIKQFLAAESLQICVKGTSGSDSSATVALPQPGQAFSDAPIKATSTPTGSTISSRRQLGSDRVFNLLISVSSAFELDVPLPVIEPSDAWLENATCLLPPEWSTYRCAYTIYSHGWVENISTMDVWLRAGGSMKKKSGPAELHCPKASERRLLPAHLSSVGKLRVGTFAGASNASTGRVRWGGEGVNAERLVCWRYEEQEGGERTGKATGRWRKVVLEAIVESAPAPFTNMRVIRLYDSVTLENLTSRNLYCWAVGSTRAPTNVSDRTRPASGRLMSRTSSHAAATRASVIRKLETTEARRRTRQSTSHLTRTRTLMVGWRSKGEDELSGEQEEESVWVDLPPGGFKRIDADTTELRVLAAEAMGTAACGERHTGPAQSAFGGWSHEAFLSTVNKITGQSRMRPEVVNIEEIASIYVRQRCGIKKNWFAYENIRIHIQKFYQGVVTVVRFETAEHRYEVRNDTNEHVLIQQKGVTSEGEVLVPGQRLPFLWYVPRGTTELTATVTKVESSTIGVGNRSSSEGGMFKMEWLMNRSGENLPVIHTLDPTSGVEVLRIMTKQGHEEWMELQKEQLEEMLREEHDDGEIELHMEGLGLALIDATPLQLLYASLDEIQVCVSAAPLRDEQLWTMRTDSMEFRREATTMSMSRLRSGTGTQALTGGSQSVQSLFPQAPTTTEAITPGSKNSKGLLHRFSMMMDQTFWQFITSFEIPPIDITVQMLNLQVDSHVPGSFYPSAARPFHTRAPLWRSMRFFAPRQVDRETRKPVFMLKVSGCQVIPAGHRFVISRCQVEMDKIIVNLDEANIVGVCAYYCKLACYFSLPPFSPEGHEGSRKRHGERSVLEEDILVRRNWRDQDEVVVRTMAPPRTVSAISKEPTGESNAKVSRREWSLMVEREMTISELTTYISIRLRESMNPYLENLQRDAKLGTLLGRLMVLFAAAAFQPAMVMVVSSKLEKMQTSMTLPEMGKLMQEHYCLPLQRKLQLTLFASMDWLGNPMHLFKGVVGGFRELVRLPYKKGLMGVPLGIRVCMCSVLGSLVDCLGRLLNSLFKGVDRLIFMLYKKLGAKAVNRLGVAFFGLDKNPVDVPEGVRRGGQLVLIRSRLVVLNIREAWAWFKMKAHQPNRWKYCAPLYFLVLALVVSVTLVLGVVEVVLIFFVNLFQGVASALYRGSAEYVSDIAPLQSFALELPVHMRPLRHVAHPDPHLKDHNRGMRQVMSQFAFLPSLAQAHLTREDYMPEWMRNMLAVRQKGASLPGDEIKKEEHVAWAVWAGAAPEGASKKIKTGSRERSGMQLSQLSTRSTALKPAQPDKALADGEAQLLIATEDHVYLLKVCDWGNTKSSGPGVGRPARVKASYTWLWKLSRSDLRSVHLKPRRLSRGDDFEEDDHWLLYLHAGGYDKAHGGITKKVVFSDRDQAWRAYQLLHHHTPRQSIRPGRRSVAVTTGINSESSGGVYRNSRPGLDSNSSENAAEFPRHSQNLIGFTFT